jgi:hypothetical protein
MAQHLWHENTMFRLCEVCRGMQALAPAGWMPPISPVCTGDDDDATDRRLDRPRPLAPHDAGKVLEMA